MLAFNQVVPFNSPLKGYRYPVSEKTAEVEKEGILVVQNSKITKKTFFYHFFTYQNQTC